MTGDDVSGGVVTIVENDDHLNVNPTSGGAALKVQAGLVDGLRLLAMWSSSSAAGTITARSLIMRVPSCPAAPRAYLAGTASGVHDVENGGRERDFTKVAHHWILGWRRSERTTRAGGWRRSAPPAGRWSRAAGSAAGAGGADCSVAAWPVESVPSAFSR